MPQQACLAGNRDAGRTWFQAGKLPTIEYAKSRDLLSDHEKKDVDWLQAFCIAPKVTVEDGGAAANIDFEIGGAPWEMKNATNSASSVRNQIKRARVKWWKLGIKTPDSYVFTMVDCTEPIEAVANGVSSRLRDGERALIVSEGGMRRLRG